jgi:hypothetical protein
MTHPVPAGDGTRQSGLPEIIPQVIPAPGSRLEQLLDMRVTAEAAVTEAQARLEAVKSGIEAEVYALHPGCPVIDIAGGPNRKALRQRWHPGVMYVPAGDLREKYPGIWKELEKQKRGGWRLTELGERA